jgi:endoglucanase
MRSESLDFLKSIADTPSPSGKEHDIAKLFSDYVGPYADRVAIDINGNVLASINPDAETRIMLAGHMDEIGFIVQYISEYGLVHFGPVGGNDGAVAVGQRVWIKGREFVPGVVGYKAAQMLEPSEQTQKPAIKDLWIDIGASSRDEAEKLVSLGDTATLDNEFQPLHGSRAAARAFDNKAGLFIIAEALRLLSEDGGLAEAVGVYAVATVQEEIGSRGAQTAAFHINPKTAIAVDMGQAKDIPGILARQYGVFHVGKGPGIAKGANTNPVVFSLLCDTAKEDGIPYQVTVIPGTSPTDERVLQVSRSGVATGLLEIPLRYMHTPSEVLDLTDVENCARLMAAYCRRIKANTDFTPR